MPTNMVRSVMKKSLPCRCELAGSDRTRLWRLFGLSSKTDDDPAGLRRLERLRAIDLPPAAVGKPTTRPSAAFSTATLLSQFVSDEFNIQGQGNASSASVAAALGTVPVKSGSPERAREPRWLRTKFTLEETEKRRKEGRGIAETYLCESVLVQNALLEPCCPSGTAKQLAQLPQLST